MTLISFSSLEVSQYLRNLKVFDGSIFDIIIHFFSQNGLLTIEMLDDDNTVSEYDDGEEDHLEERADGSDSEKDISDVEQELPLDGPPLIGRRGPVRRSSRRLRFRTKYF